MIRNLSSLHKLSIENNYLLYFSVIQETLPALTLKKITFQFSIRDLKLHIKILECNILFAKLMMKRGQSARYPVISKSPETNTNTK